MNKLKHWLSKDENRLQLSKQELYLRINELDTNVVAVKASNVFPITYSLLANVSP